jgi:RNA polymerase sigma-70 factor (ECF subfamily)
LCPLPRGGLIRGVDAPTDDELLRAWRAGDGPAGASLFRRHFPAVFRFFRSKLPDQVEDMTQRTFLACLEAGDRLDGVRSFRAYLYGICRNQLLRHLEEKNRVRRIEDLVERSVEDLADSPVSVVAVAEERELLVRGLRRIPVDLQIALELFYWEQVPLADIAGVLGIPEGTVKSRLFRAKKLLRGRIEEIDADPALRESTLQGVDTWIRGLRDDSGAPP